MQNSIITFVLRGCDSISLVPYVSGPILATICRREAEADAGADAEAEAEALSGEHLIHNSTFWSKDLQSLDK